MNKRMRALQLFSPNRETASNSSSCLLVYAEPDIRDVGISSDIREVYANKPSTSHIYVLAPFCDPADVISSLAEGTSLIRAKPYIQDGGSFSVINLAVSKNSIDIVSIRLGWNGESVEQYPELPLDRHLQDAWLFDLFNQNGGRVTPPTGVHFRKGSGKHTDEFLRTANILLSSHACGLLAYFSLAQFGPRPPRQVLVDTAPLISVAQAMFQIASKASLWKDSVPIKSFSSYGGLHAMPRLSRSDWVIVSASTSGALAAKLVERGAARQNVTTLYYLQSDDSSEMPQGLLCNLTFRPENNFGYSPIVNYRADSCPLCAKGFILAELEGDQFLFQKREIRRIKVKKKSQGASARIVLEKLARKNIFQFRLQPSVTDCSLLNIAGDDLIRETHTRNQLVRQLRRFSPSPLKYVVLSDVSEAEARALLVEAHGSHVKEEVKFLTWAELSMAEEVPGGGALVLFGMLNDHARARQINAALRGVVPKGAVTYIAALTLAETPEELTDLQVFLTYGEFGRDTFIYRSVYELAFPVNARINSAWTTEYDLLAEICAEPNAPAELQQRKRRLETHAIVDTQIFLTRPESDLAIKNDFVYLETGERRDLISQADILCVVANALASARCHDRTIDSGRGKDVESRMRSSLYGHTLLCPENFRNYNDSILRAAFLRLSEPSEIGYAVDETCSHEMLEIIVDEIAAWERGAGDALPEFFLALSSGRLSLDDRHMASLKLNVNKVTFPSYMQALINTIPF